MPKIKIEHISFAETIKKIIIEIINAETECLLEINVLLDQNKRLLIVFALKDRLHNLANNLSTNQILSDLKNQGCIFEIMQNKGNSAVLTIPEYRLL